MQSSGPEMALQSSSELRQGGWPLYLSWCIYLMWAFSGKGAYPWVRKLSSIEDISWGDASCELLHKVFSYLGKSASVLKEVLDGAS